MLLNCGCDFFECREVRRWIPSSDTELLLEDNDEDDEGGAPPWVKRLASDFAMAIKA